MLLIPSLICVRRWNASLHHSESLSPTAARTSCLPLAVGLILAPLSRRGRHLMLTRLPLIKIRWSLSTLRARTLKWDRTWGLSSLQGGPRRKCDTRGLAFRWALTLGLSQHLSTLLRTDSLAVCLPQHCLPCHLLCFRGAVVSTVAPAHSLAMLLGVVPVRPSGSMKISAKYQWVLDIIEKGYSGTESNFPLVLPFFKACHPLLLEQYKFSSSSRNCSHSWKEGT